MDGGEEMSGVRDARLRIARVFALGQQEDMWLRLRSAQICLRQTSHIPGTLSEMPSITLKRFKNKNEIK